MRLIINADDYGITHEVSKGILHCMKHGIVTSTSAIVNGADFFEYADLAIKSGVTKMGLHCLATMGTPLTDPQKIPSLVDQNGRFFTRDIFTQREIVVEELELELTAQMNRFLQSGLILDHIDTHHGFMTQSLDIFDLFIRLAKHYNVPLRNEVSRKETLSDAYQKQLKESGVPTVERVYFNKQSPVHTFEEIIQILTEASQQYSIIEIGCHPGYCDEILKSMSPLNTARECELQLFQNEALKQRIKTMGIERVSYELLRSTQ